MKTTFHVGFLDQQQGGSTGYARLEVDLPFVPSIDIEFEHPVWHDGRKPRSISYNLENGSLFVVFDPDMSDEANLQQAADRYRDHGWTVA